MDKLDLGAIKPRLLTFNYLQCQRRFRTNERLLSTPYFLYVHKGKGIYMIGETQYQCSEGDLFFCPKGVPNTIIADDYDPYLLSGVEFEFSENVPEPAVSSEFKEHINIHDHQQFLWLTFELIRRNVTRDLRYAEYMHTIFHAWLILVLNLTNENPGASIAESIAAYLLANENRHVSMEEIAGKFKYHPNHINRVFKGKYGIPLCQYHQELRIKKATQLLTYSNHSVGEIAVLCGYEDINYFSRIFKQKMRVSPSQYRKGFLNIS